MVMFIQAFGAVMIAVIVGSILAKQEKTTHLLLTLGVCAMVMLAGIQYLHPVIDFIYKLENLCMNSSQWIGILLKITGIGLITEFAALICSDAGNSSLGKSLQFLAGGVILYLSIPVFNGLIDLLQQLLGEV